MKDDQSSDSDKKIRDADHAKNYTNKSEKY